jgi:ornithine carbamoyltransferase
MRQSLLTLNDITTDQFHKILNKIEVYKKRILAREKLNALEGRVIGLLFNQPSTRTRTSFETAILRLGGKSIYLSELRLKQDALIHTRGSSDELDLRYVEPIKDTARMLRSYLDGLIIRTRDHRMMEEFSQYSRMPIINANSDLCHPTQILSDLFTLKETKGSFKNLNLTYLGDGNNTCCSLLLGCAHAGINMIAACPSGSYPNKETYKNALRIAERTGARLQIMESPEESVKEADILYTDAWISMSDKRGKEGLIKIFGKYQVNKSLVDLAKKNPVIMHCLPAHRDFEITDEILESSQSLVWKQGENKVYTAAAVLDELIA